MVGARLNVHGAAGAEALIPLLAHPSEEVRRLASYALDQIEVLEPRHLPALIAAHRRGLEVENAIARTGSEEGLRYLEERWSDSWEAIKVRIAIPLFGRRAEPFLLRKLEGCRQACSRQEAGALLHALSQIGPLPDSAMAVIRDVAAFATEPQLRREMEDQLIFYSDPAGVPVLIRRLGEIRGDPYEDWRAEEMVERMGRYRELARATAGPTILAYLARADLRRARNAAVIAAWDTDYRPAIPALRRLLAEADRDWHLAYNALAVLAELGGEEARPEIEGLARTHWYRPVRNSARRALNMLNGGEFALPGSGGEQRGPYAGDLYFQADLDPVRDCRFDAASTTLRFRRDAPVPIRRAPGGAVRAALEPPSEDVRAALGEAAALRPNRLVTLNWQGRHERVVGIDGRHFEGGLYAVDGNGTQRLVLADHVLATFAMEQSLLVVTGDSLDPNGESDLWRLSLEPAIAVRGERVRLPSTPSGYAIAGDGTLVIRTERGDLAISREGLPLAPRSCAGTRDGR